METMKQSGPWSSLGTHGSLLVTWWLCVSCSGETGNFDFLSWIWPWTSRSIGILTKVFCTSGPNLVALAWMVGELWCGEAKNGVNLDFQVKFHFEGHGQSLHKTTGILTKVFYTSEFGDPCLNESRVIAQTSKWLIHTRTDEGNNNTHGPFY